MDNNTIYPGGLLVNPFLNMRLNRQPSPADLAKYGVPSDGQGAHEHSGFGPHGHGEPSYTDEQVAFLEQRGYHCDRHHNQVLDGDGDVVPPGIIGPLLLDARQQGILKAAMGVRGHEKVPACGQDEVPTRGHVEVPTPH